MVLSFVGLVVVVVLIVIFSVVVPLIIVIVVVIVCLFLDASTHLYKRLCLSVCWSNIVSQISRVWSPEDNITSGNQWKSIHLFMHSFIR